MYNNRIRLIVVLLVLVLGAFAALPVRAAVINYSISGTVTVNGVPLRGVTVTVKGTTYSAVTNTLGNYTISAIPAGTAGVLVPTQVYFTFSPSSISFASLAAPLTGKNFTATLIKPVYFTISGKVATALGAPVAGVNVYLGTLFGSTSTLGTYTITNVPILSKGRLTPKLTNWCFTPSSIGVLQLLSNLVNMNFTAYPAYSISGKITDKATGLPLSGVTVTFGTFKAVSSATGAYTIRCVPPGTSGTLVPSLLGKTFTPVSIAITPIAANLHSENFVAAP